MRLIDFALTIKGISKAGVFIKKAILFEVQHKFKKAMKEIRNAKLHSISYDSESEIRDVEKRIKGKMELVEKKKKKNKSKKLSK